MKFQDRSQIEALAKFKSQGDLVTSFYLDTDKGRMSRKEIQLALKNLLNEAKTRACELSAAKEKTESLLRDLDLIADYGSQALGTSNAAGLAVFSASQKEFWQPLELPHGPRNRVIFDANFYVRPLASILDKYSHICALLINRREAVWYDVSMGEIKFLDKLQSDVPSRVREGGFEGTAAKRIERHVDAHLQEHYKKTAQKTFELSKKHPFDWLFISCEENHSGDFETHLHSYLCDKVKARLHSRVTDPPAKVLQEVLEVGDPAEEGRGGGDRPEAHHRARARRPGDLGIARHDPSPEPVRGPDARRHPQFRQAGADLPDPQVPLPRRAQVPDRRQEDRRRPGHHRRGHRDGPQAGRDGPAGRAAVEARPLRRDRRLPEVQGLARAGLQADQPADPSARTLKAAGAFFSLNRILLNML